MTYKKLTLFIFTFLFLFQNCATYRHKVDSDSPVEKLVFVVPMYLNILMVDDESFDHNNRFYISPGKHKYIVSYFDGMYRSTNSKTVVIDGKPGDNFIFCTMYSEKIKDWIAFPAFISSEKLETYKLGLGYRAIQLQLEVCNIEAQSKGF